MSKAKAIVSLFVGAVTLFAASCFTSLGMSWMNERSDAAVFGGGAVILVTWVIVGAVAYGLIRYWRALH